MTELALVWLIFIEWWVNIDFLISRALQCFIFRISNSLFNLISKNLGSWYFPLRWKRLILRQRSIICLSILPNLLLIWCNKFRFQMIWSHTCWCSLYLISSFTAYVIWYQSCLPVLLWMSNASLIYTSWVLTHSLYAFVLPH